MDPEVREITAQVRAHKRYQAMVFGAPLVFVVGLLIHPPVGFLLAGSMWVMAGVVVARRGKYVNIEPGTGGGDDYPLPADPHSEGSPSAGRLGPGLRLIVSGLCFAAFGIWSWLR